MLVTISFGSTNLVRKDFPNGTLMGQAIRDRSVQATLQYGDNVQGTIGGVPVVDNAPLFEGAHVVVTTKECGKATN